MTPFEIRLIEDYEIDSWDEMTATSPAGTIFHTSVWRTVIDSAYGDGSYVLIGAFDKNGLAGGFCALTRKRLGVDTAVTPLATPYTGFLVKEWEGLRCSDATAQEGSVIEAVTRYLVRYRYQNIQCAPGLADFRPLVDAGYKLTPRATLEINLRLPEDELWDSFQGHVRRNIRKAHKSAFEVTDQWDFNQGVDIFQQTFARHGQASPVPEKLFHEICDGTALAGYRQRYCAWQDGRLQAFLIAVRYNGRVYYELAGAATDALKAGVSSLLVWEMLRDHLGGQWDIFDFVGANTRTISRFKEGFNPVLRTHLQAEYCSSRRIGFGRGIQRLLRRRK